MGRDLSVWVPLGYSVLCHQNQCCKSEKLLVERSDPEPWLGYGKGLLHHPCSLSVLNRSYSILKSPPPHLHSSLPPLSPQQLSAGGFQDSALVDLQNLANLPARTAKSWVLKNALWCFYNASPRLERSINFLSLVALEIDLRTQWVKHDQCCSHL